MSPADDRFERLLGEVLQDAAPSQPPASLMSEAERTVSTTRRWPRPWAILREPPMRQGAGVVVGSVTTRRVAILAATLLLVLLTVSAGIAGSNLLASPAVIVVDQSGRGDATTITEAVALAEDGDEILIRPGTYTEAVTVEKDVILKGDGPRDQIVLMAPEGGPLHRTGHARSRQYALLLLGVDATVEGLTLRGEASRLNIDGGAPIVRDVALEGVGRPHTMPRGRYTFPDAVALTETRATIIGNTVTNGGAITSFEGAPQIIDNVLIDGPSIHAYYPGDEALIAGNLVSGSLDRAIGVFGANHMAIEDNTVRNAQGDGISVGIYTDPGNEPIVRRNSIEGTEGPGIYVAVDTNPSLTDNRLCGYGEDLVADNGRFVEYRAMNELCENDRRVIVVDQVGLGDATSITQALDAANDGDVIVVRPGDYGESVGIAKDVRLRADGPDATVTVSDPSAASVLTVTDSSPTVTGFVFEGDVLVGDGASATLEENRIVGDVALVEAGLVTLKENELWSVDIDPGSSAVVRDNIFDDQSDRGATAVDVEQRHANNANERVVVEGNRIEGPYAYGIYVTNNRGPQVDVQRNVIRDAEVGVVIRGTGPTSFEANDVVGNATGIRVGSDSLGSSIRTNLIEANDVGVHLLGAARPAMSDNHFCDNATDLDAAADSRVTLEHDQVCEDPAAN